MAQIAMFAMNTRWRDSDVCNLRWDWQMKVPELDIEVFIIPGQYAKNGDRRLVVVNRIV